MIGSKADRVKQEYKFMCNEAPIIEKLKSFKRTENRLDHFWVETAKMCSKPCDNFVDFIKLVLILSHGNAAVERGFSINEECLMENQREKSLIALRRICDFVQNAGGLENIQIDKSLIHSMRNAHLFYNEDKKKEHEKLKVQQEQNLLKRKNQEEIKNLQFKRAKISAEAAKLEEDI